MPELDTEKRESKGKASSAPFSDPEKAREAAKASVAARRRKAEAREQTAEENALTVRQKVGVALSKLSQADWDALVKGASVQQRVQLMNQAFGTPKGAEDDTPTDGDLATLTKDQRAALRAMIEDTGSDPRGEASDAREEEGTPSPPAPGTPANDEPLARESPGRNP